MFVLIFFLHFLLCASGCVLQLSALQIFCKGTTFLFICNSLSVLNLIFPLSVFFLRAVRGEGGSVCRAVLPRLFPGFWASASGGFRRAIYNKVLLSGKKIEKAVRFFYQANCIEFKVRRLTREIHYRFNAHGVCRRYTSMRNPLQAAERRSCGCNCMRG